MSARTALLVVHTGRADIVEFARTAAERLKNADFEVRALADEAADLGDAPLHAVPDDARAADGAEIVLVLGGDGTFLRAAEYARPAGAPLLGVNLGRVGFLAEAEPDAVHETIKRIVARDYEVESRMTLDVTIGAQTTWALNEASVEKSVRERMLEVVIQVDDRVLTRFGCDGVVCATPTGSTAYAFSAGGPIVWPTMDALLVVPNNAHALFARPLIVDPESTVTIEPVDDRYDAVVCCDGRRGIDVPTGHAVQLRRGELPVRIVRMHGWSFTERLVEKFALPTDSFRNRRRGIPGV